MSKEEIIEGNKLIAIFDGYVFYPNDILNDTKGVFRKDGYMPMLEHDFKYHSSLDLLMPVVEKIYIRRDVEDISIKPGRTRIWIKGNSYIESPNLPQNTSVIECWLAVIHFIKLTHKKTPTNE